MPSAPAGLAAPRHEAASVGGRRCAHSARRTHAKPATLPATGSGPARRRWLREPCALPPEKGSAAVSKAQELHAKAAECDLKADRAKDPEASRLLREAAASWRSMAIQAERLGW